MVRRLATPRTHALAKALRAAPPTAEPALWELVRERRIAGYKFRRRSIVLGWIPDFWCPEASLAIEIDGRDSEGKMRRDKNRDVVLAEHGIRTIHIAAVDIYRRPAWVARRIERVLRRVDIGRKP